MRIDFHTHLATLDALPDIFFDGWRDNIRRLMPPDVPKIVRERVPARFGLGPEDPLGDRHVAEMDAAGVGLAVSLIIDFGLAFPGQVPELTELFAAHRAMAARHPGRFLVFAGVDPRRGAEGLELFERSLVEWGFRGLKLYPPCGFSPSDRRLDPFYALCAEHRAPVVIHTGPTTPKLSFAHTHPSDVDDAAWRFPGVDFVLAHGTVVHTEAASLLAEYRPNVYLDTSGFQSEHRRGRWGETLGRLKERGLLRKVLYGTDCPVHRQYGPQSTWIERVGGGEDGPLTPAEVRWILEDNPREILGLET